MINLARMQLVSRDRAELEASLSDSRLCQKWQGGVSCFPISALLLPGCKTTGDVGLSFPISPNGSTSCPG